MVPPPTTQLLPTVWETKACASPSPAEAGPTSTRVRAGRALRCRLVQEDFKPRGKGLAQGRGATQREHLGAGGSGGGGVGGRRQQDPQGWLSPPASPGSLPKPAASSVDHITYFISFRALSTTYKDLFSSFSSF